ncbi:MAG: hypothetical protein KGQ51_15130 [Planctomycetes bacterium]|nr:hypothetical protein [Planctomycetota bacterium]
MSRVAIVASLGTTLVSLLPPMIRERFDGSGVCQGVDINPEWVGRETAGACESEFVNEKKTCGWSAIIDRDPDSSRNTNNRGSNGY